MGATVMKKWPFKVHTYSPQEVRNYCVEDRIWQKFRLTRKGISTEDKLDRLKGYYEDRSGRRFDVQVSNYINALKRGGQLAMDLTVQR